MNFSISFFAMVLIAAMSQAAEPGVLAEAEARLQAIYDRGEFRGNRFQAEWLPDSTGYITTELAKNPFDPSLARIDVPSGKRTVLKSRPEGMNRSSNRSPDGKRIVVSERGDLFVREPGSGRRIRLTNTGAERLIWNQRPVWSPDGKWIVFVESDDSQIKVRSSIGQGDPTFPEVRTTRFARVGEAIPKLRVGVVDAEGKAIRWLAIPIPTEGYYLGQVDWASNDEVLVEQMSRFRNKRDFYLCNVHTGAITRIFHEADPAWVVASYQINAGLDWIRGGKAFVVLSEMDGWRHAYVYSREGKQERKLTPGDFDIIGRAKIDEDGGWFYYYASPDNATQKYLYRVRLDGSGKPERVTPQDQPGTHDYDFSPDAKWAFHTVSRFDQPPVTELVQLPDHKVIRVLEDNKAVVAKLKSVKTEPTEFLTIDVNGFTMDAWMIKPKAFDPSKKYPVLVYVYGEPHAQTVLDSWGTSHADYHRMIADLGYLVVSIDNRGTPAPKGAAWRRSIFKSLGPLSTEEQAAAITELGRQRPYVDLSRVGIWGWSGGGSNTLNAMFRKPDVYKVGIAVAPKPQPHLYNAWFQEIYMETRETNPEGYQKSAPINFAEGLKGDLLIIHGTGETNTHIQITEGLVDRLIELGKRFDYMAYPHRDHGLREGKGTNVHMRLLMVRYLLDHL